MTTTKACADKNQTLELFTIILNNLNSPFQIWQGFTKLLQAIEQKQHEFGNVAGEFTIQDDRTPDGYAKWELSISQYLTNLKSFSEEAYTIPIEGKLTTNPLVWLPSSTRYLEIENLRDPHESNSAFVELKPMKTDDDTLSASPTAYDLNAYRLPRLPLDAPDNSALSLYIFYDKLTEELSLSAEIWLDLWLPRRFDGSNNEPWAEVNFDYLKSAFKNISEDLNCEFESFILD
ncbi:MAG: hypothetical protein F6K00_18735 [Leptolyngbya sp. SIOISBB]|nr:hypothetical protein [Leptolyngbya sp. SIOISBB]